MTDVQAESWKAIPDHPNYEASTAGRIRNAKTGKLMHARAVQCKSGIYYKTNIGSGPTKKNTIQPITRWIHRLICATFHGPAPAGQRQVRHLDGDPSNNTAQNLAWGNQSMNEQDKKDIQQPREDEVGEAWEPSGVDVSFNYPKEATA